MFWHLFVIGVVGSRKNMRVDAGGARVWNFFL